MKQRYSGTVAGVDMNAGVLVAMNGASTNLTAGELWPGGSGDIFEYTFAFTVSNADSVAGRTITVEFEGYSIINIQTPYPVQTFVIPAGDGTGTDTRISFAARVIMAHTGTVSAKFRIRLTSDNPADNNVTIICTTNDDSVDVQTVIGAVPMDSIAIAEAILEDPTTPLDNDVDGSVAADVTKISGDATAADNQRDTYNGTGYSNGVAPATQDQVAGIANTGAAINQIAFNDVTTYGDDGGSDYTETQALDGVYNQVGAEFVNPDFAIDKYYEFNIGATGIPVSVTLSGRLQTGNPVGGKFITIQAWDYVSGGGQWVDVGTLDAVSSASDAVKTIILTTTKLTALGSGIVQLRFVNLDIDSLANLYIDFLYCSYSIQGSVVGYAGGSIWIDTINGTEGTIVGYNGTADNPCKTILDAFILSGPTYANLRRFQIVSGTIVDLIADAPTMVGVGEKWVLGLEGFDISLATVIGADVTGNANAASIGSEFIDCHFGTDGVGVGLTPSTSLRCGLKDEIRLLAQGTYVFHSCYSEIAGTGTPSIDFSDGAGGSAVNFRQYSGGIEVKSMAAGDTMSLEGDGQIVVAAGITGGVIAIRGSFTKSGDATSIANITWSEDARYDKQQVRDSMAINHSAIAQQSASIDSKIDATNTQLDGIDGNIDNIIDVQEGDEVFDYGNGTVTIYEKGSLSNPLLKKTLYDKNDVKVADTEAIIARTEDVEL
jgi:hypothetical protein